MKIMLESLLPVSAIVPLLTLIAAHSILVVAERHTISVCSSHHLQQM